MLLHGIYIHNIPHALVVEGGSVNRCFKTPVIIANTGYRKGLSRKLGYGKIAALFLHIPTSRGDRPASPPNFSASRFSRNFYDLETPIIFTEPPSSIIVEVAVLLYVLLCNIWSQNFSQRRFA
jgi:hypothetical protein